MFATNPKFQAGYIALTTAIIISATLLLFIVAVNYQGFTSRFIILESEYKTESTYLAEACINIARLNISQDPTYHDTATFPETWPVGIKQCVVVDVFGPNLNSLTIHAQGVADDAVTNLEVEVDASPGPDVVVTSWRELPSF